jgi:hypothetical protein
VIKIRIDDSQIMEFAKTSPARARWATGEALKMAGGHTRKGIRAHIEQGDPSWAPLSDATKALMSLVHPPLKTLVKTVSFKFSQRSGSQSVAVGFLTGSLQRIARRVQYGGRVRVTPELRERFHLAGIHLRPRTRMLNIPPRPIIEPFWRKNERHTLNYIEKNFFEKFFSKEKPKLRY